MKRAPLLPPDRVVSGRSRAPQRDQIVRNVAQLADDLGGPEVAGGRISGAAEGDRADDAGLVRRRLSLHDRQGGLAVAGGAQRHREIRTLQLKPRRFIVRQTLLVHPDRRLRLPEERFNTA